MTRSRSLARSTHTRSIHSPYSIRPLNLIYRTLSCLYQIFFYISFFPIAFQSRSLLGWGILDLVNSCRRSRSLHSPPLAPDLYPWPPFIRGYGDVFDRLDWYLTWLPWASVAAWLRSYRSKSRGSWRSRLSTRLLSPTRTKPIFLHAVFLCHYRGSRLSLRETSFLCW